VNSTFYDYRRSFVATFLALFIVLNLGATQSSQREEDRISRENQAVLDRITADSLRGHLSFIASDLLEGRDTPSRGLEIASEYIAAQFRRAGLEPLGDDGYFQTANMLETVPQLIGFSLVISRKEGDIEVGPEQVTMFLDEGLNVSRAKLFKVNSDDPATIASLTPDQVGGQVIIAERSRSGWGDVLEKLYALKPSLIIRVSRQMVRSDGVATRRLIDPERREAEKPPANAPVLAVVNQNVLDFFDETKTGLTGATVSLRAPAAVEKPVKLRNVIGLLRGSDPALRGTYVFVTAHYDHLGVDRSGRIYNGANDNGSGTVTVMELASAIASRATHPRRGVVFMTFFGEEKGAIGSEYYVRRPVLPIEKTVADVNLEQLGRTDSLEGPQVASATLTGFDFTDMTATFIAAGKLTGIRMYKHERFSDRYFNYSDNRPFAEQGIPAQTLGVLFQYPDYHDVGDKANKIDYDNMAKVDRLVALGLLMIADAPGAPRWNEASPRTTPYVQAWKLRHPQ